RVRPPGRSGFWRRRLGPLRHRPAPRRPARADRRGDWTDLGSQPRVAHPRRCAVVHLLSPRVFRPCHRAAHSAHAHVDRYRIARFGLCLSQLRQQRRCPATPLGPRLFHRQPAHPAAPRRVYRRDRIRTHRHHARPRRARRAGRILRVAVSVAVAVAVHDCAQRVSAGLIASAWALPLHVLTAVAAIGAILALWFRRWHVARIAAAAQVSLILWGWAAAQAPYLVPPSLTVENAAAPRRTQLIFLVALALGALVLFPSMTYLFRLFKTARVHETVPTGRNDSV